MHEVPSPWPSVPHLSFRAHALASGDFCKGEGDPVPFLVDQMPNRLGLSLVSAPYQLYDDNLTSPFLSFLCSNTGTITVITG